MFREAMLIHSPEHLTLEHLTRLPMISVLISGIKITGKKRMPPIRSGYLEVTVINTSGAVVNNVPVILKVDGLVISTENILTIPANDTVHYTFNPGTANLSAPGNHSIEVWVSYSSDNVRENDTARITVNSLPYITSFPYLENFEANNGYWYTT